MAHKIELRPRGEAIVGGKLQVEVFINPEGDLKCSAAQAHFGWDPAILGQPRLMPDEPGELGETWELLPGMGVYAGFQGPGRCFYVWMSELGAIPTIPDAGQLAAVLEFPVLGAGTTTMSVLPSQTYDNGQGYQYVCKTGLFDGTVAGLLLDTEGVGATITADDTQAPPDTPEQKFARTMLMVTGQHAGPAAPLIMGTFQAALATYMAERGVTP